MARSILAGKGTMNIHLITSVLLLLHITGRGVQTTFTNEFIANIEGGLEVADTLAASYGYINLGETENFPDHYVFHHVATEKRSIKPSRGDHTAIKHEAAVHWIEQQKIRKRVKRGLEWINDPMYRQQWYMNREDAPNMNVEAAWEMGYTGKGIVVSILDDGIDYTHPDLAKNYDPLASWDINGKDNDPMPRANYDQTNRHGTRCAGEVAMEAGNNLCGVGVAYNASIGGIRMLDDQVTDKVEGDSLAAQRNHIDIYSASWGPEDNGMTVDGPGRLAKQSFHNGIKKGRDGKGNIFVWASGNGGRAKDSCGCDGYTNSIYTISVSSVSERGDAPWYLEECASTLATTYSSGSPKEKKVITTDLGGRCTNDHTGTSASAPLAAGLCALALQANPNMTWRDMQYVIVMTSHNSSLYDSDWLVNGAGYSFSHRYGFGLMDAGAMVQLASNWINLPEQLSCEISLLRHSRQIRGHGILSTFRLNTTACENGPNYLEQVQSTVDVTFGRRGALVLTLISPSGTHSRLLDRRPKDRKKGSFSSWPFKSVHFWGERAKGVWTLQVENGLPKSNSGLFRGWSLTLYGTDFLPRTATLPKKPKTRQGSQSPISKMKDVSEIKESVDHSRIAIPRSSDYSPCHPECFNGCSGPLASDCFKCLHYRDRSTYECVAHCPDGYYDPPEVHTKCKACAQSCRTCAGPSQSDCLSCDTPLFFMESHSKCVQTCDEKFVKDIQSHACIPCLHPLCEMCEGSPNYCLACAPPAMLSIDNTCQSTCSTNEYLEGNVCRSCHETCYTCSGRELNDCLTCVPGSVLKERTCVQEWRCTDGYYVADGRECLKCHVSCKNCNGQSSSECTECSDRNILQYGACIQNCLEGYFKSSADCLACSYGCNQCTSGDNCVQCQSEFVLVKGNCKRGCSDGNYEHEGYCMSCHELCETCIGGGPEDCTSCKLNQDDVRYLLEGACVPFCPEGQYEDQQTLNCEECDETCKTCNGSEINNCQSCYSGFHLTQNVCEEQESSHCNADCKDCLMGFANRCISCPTDKYLMGFDCVDNCTGGYFVDEDECIPCHPSCKNCSGASSQDCTSCHVNQFLYDDSTCDSHCPYTTYRDSGDGTCKDCHFTCQSCSGPGRSACETCEGTYFWNDNECVSDCPNGTYADEGEQQCMSCFPSCQTCDGPLAEHCLTCIDGLELTGSRCKPGDCPARTYEDGGTCNDCHFTCQRCIGPEANQCQMCNYDRFLNESNQCIEVCDTGYYPDYDNNLCQPCHSSCKTCVQGGPQDCMDCENGLYILSKEEGVFCVDHCPEGFYLLEEGPDEDRSWTCQLCSPQCLDCSSSYSHCISCRDNTFLFRDQCIPNCPGGFVENVESNRCLVKDRICPLHCTSCNEWGECLECEEDFVIQYGECLPPTSQCPENQYQVVDSSGNRQCRNCVEHCKRCLGSRDGECLICNADYQLNNGHCRQNCSAKQFDQDGICVACHPSCENCNGPSPYECTACPEGMVHTTGNSDQGECSIGCPRGTFRQGEQCLACHDTCQNCKGNSPNDCLSCKPHFFLTGDQQCVQTCLDGTYRYLKDDDSGSPSEFECRPCHSSCKTCNGPLETECTTCHDSMYRLDGKCVGHCGTGYYPGKQSLCQPCHANCTSCWSDGEDQCITCAYGKKLLDGRCVDECPLNNYLSLDFIPVCKPCHERCKTCYDMGPFNCLSCFEGYELEDNVCYSRCDLGTYFVDQTKRCLPCDPTCKECYGATDKHCIVCNSGQSLWKVDEQHYTCLKCCKEGLDQGNCCQCNKDGQCMSVQENGSGDQAVVRPQLNSGAIIFVCLLVMAVFGLFFGLLQARSRKKLCWKDTYEQLPAFYSKMGEKPQITLRQNALPSSDEEDDYFDDSDF